MSGQEFVNSLRKDATSRKIRTIDLPRDHRGEFKRVSEFYGENIFDFQKCPDIQDTIKKEILKTLDRGETVKKEHAEIVANAAKDWAIKKGATHFCHWFQPLTGATAEKHDAFLQIDKNGKAIERLSAGQLMQGEPDASSFPNGGSRSTFEARGYTTWDLSSPMFITEGVNGKTLNIPTAFVSYLGDALDVKTPLLRSIACLNEAATKFLNLTGHSSQSVYTTCGAEQEYFLVDKAFYFARPDLVMTGRTVFGTLTSKNQQLEDHYFGVIPDRVLAFMQELDLELHRLGIPAKTRHNEVAPGQFELAPIFSEANIAADNNQVIMSVLRRVAERHDFVALLHEKPFAGINGSGKHVNWSMSDNLGLNLLEPGLEPHQNLRFLATVSMIVEAVCRRSKALRMAISGAGNDHRLGANEAPPSIMSVYLGDTIEKIFASIMEEKSFTPNMNNMIDLGAKQLLKLAKDNTDRNRTSPFAFTGNKFEFRAVGSSHAIGFPLSVLNTAVAEVMLESNQLIEADLKSGLSIDDALLNLIKKRMKKSGHVVFNGDGYSKEWVEEAKRRGLPNLRTTPEALSILKDPTAVDFLVNMKVFGPGEVETRHNVLVERYNKIREIELETQIEMVRQYVMPSAIEYKLSIARVIEMGQKVGVEAVTEREIYKTISQKMDELHREISLLEKELHQKSHDEAAFAQKLASELMPVSQKVAHFCNELEEMVSVECWKLPKYFDMLFLR